MEGELKAGDLAARLEVIQASTANETVERDVPDNIRAEKEPIVAQSYSTSETIVDPWRRTVSQLSLGSALEPEMNSCRIEIITGDVTGPFYDRHRVYLVSVPSQVLIHSFKTDHQTF
jgi:hypothetical protein